MRNRNERRSSMTCASGGASSQPGTAAMRQQQLQTAGHRRSTVGSLTTNASNTMNLEVIKHLEGVFRKADQDGSGQLDMDEFVAAFRGVINTPEGSDDAALRKLFMRIDANCDAAVDWNEFSAYLLLEKTTSTGGPAVPGSTGAGGLPELAYNPVEVPAATAAAAHTELISSVVHVDTGMGPDRWYSTARDGTVKVWNGKDLSPLRTLQTPLQCITCSTFTPCSNLLALGSYSANILLLDVSTGDQAGVLNDAASSAALSVTSWREGGDGILDNSEARELMVVGDADGGINMIQIHLDSTADRKNKARYRGRTLWQAQNHHDWVVSVLHMPQLNSILAASLDKKLTMTDVERCIAIKTLEGHQKSVTCCAWSGMYKMAISGSADKQVMLWNPFSCRPMGTLTGHAAGIVAMTLNERDHQIITAAEDKTIKVWDLRNQLCLQTLVDPSTYTPDNTLSAVCYSPSRKLLVSVAYSFRPWPLTDNRGTGGTGHRDPVSWVGYNNMFAEVVSTDHAGTVCVWHVSSGRLRFCYANTHGGARISAATYDRNYRRLITGSDDGQVKVWNFSSGVLLSTLDRPHSSHGMMTGSGAEVTGIVVSGGNKEQNILVTGWDKKISWYDDSGKRISKLLRSSSGPTTDVLAAAIMEGYPTLATACYDGEIWLWNLESGVVRRKLVVSGHVHKPESERPVEKLVFMRGELRHILLAVGADRMLRFWDCFTGVCLVEQFTGHKQGESVVALTLAPDNSTVVTADTAGYIMVWDVSKLKLPSVSKSQARPSMVTPLMTPTHFCGSTSAANNIQRLAVWKGHSDAVTALDWVVAPTPEAQAAAAESAGLTAAETTEAVDSEDKMHSRQDGDETTGHRDMAVATPPQGDTQHYTPCGDQQPDHNMVHGSTLEMEAVGQCGGDEPPCAGPTHNISQQQHRQRQEHPPGLLPSVGYIVSGSLDRRLVMWSSSGALVGVFGRNSWSLEDMATWQCKTRMKLKEDEKFDMLVSAHSVEHSHLTPGSASYQPEDDDQQAQHIQTPRQASLALGLQLSTLTDPAHITTCSQVPCSSRPCSAGALTSFNNHTIVSSSSQIRPSTASRSSETSGSSVTRGSRQFSTGSRQHLQLSPSANIEALTTERPRGQVYGQQHHCSASGTRLTGSSISTSAASSTSTCPAETFVHESNDDGLPVTSTGAVAQLSRKLTSHTTIALNSLKEQHDIEALDNDGIRGQTNVQQLGRPAGVIEVPCIPGYATPVQGVIEQPWSNKLLAGDAALQQQPQQQQPSDTDVKKYQLEKARAAIAAYRLQHPVQQQQQGDRSIGHRQRFSSSKVRNRCNQE